MEKKVFDIEAKRILIFLGITFLFTYLLEIFLISPLVKSDDMIKMTIGQSLIAMMMFIPAIGVLLTRLLTREGFKNLWIGPNLKGNIKYYIFAWFGPIVLTIIGGLLYFLVYPNNLTFEMEYLSGVYEASGIEVDISQLKQTIIIQGIVAIFLSPVLNALTCFGEEWGWRGYLLPKMSEKFKVLPMLLINGVIWGLWHGPLTVLGHNYGVGYIGYPYLGILSMCIFCIVLGTFFSYISLKTKSCIPAVIAHGSINGFSAIAIYLTKDGGNPFIGPAPIGIIGGIAFIVVAIICAYLLMKEERSKVEVV